MSAGSFKDINYVASLEQRIATLEAENAKLRRDAERYRWLRETLHSAKAGGTVSVNEVLVYYEIPESGKEVSIQWYPDTPVGFYVSEASTRDAAIDAAMLAERSKP